MKSEIFSQCSGSPKNCGTSFISLPFPTQINNKYRPSLPNCFPTPLSNMVPLALRIAFSFARVLFLLPFHLVMRGRLTRNSLSKLDCIMGGIRKGAIAHRFSVYILCLSHLFYYCRGGQPENTINAFRKSKELGATAVEVSSSPKLHSLHISVL